MKLGFMSFFVKACVAAVASCSRASTPRWSAATSSTRSTTTSASRCRRRRASSCRCCATATRARSPTSRRASPSSPSSARTGKLALARPRGRHVHDHERRHLRLDDVDAAAQLSADRHPRHAQHRQARRRGRRRGRRAADDVRRAVSYDHRVVDGREAVSFLVAVKERLEAPERLLVEV